MINAKEELLDEVGDKDVKYIGIRLEPNYRYKGEFGAHGTLEEVLPLMDFEYDDGYGGQRLFGFIWYEDGTWPERGEYDGSEWWQYKTCPSIDDWKENHIKGDD